MNKLIYLSFLLTVVSCRKDGITIYSGDLKNATTHSIKILFYSKGAIINQNTINLNSGTEIQIGHGSERGVVNHGGFGSDYFSGVDSVHVVFDNTYRTSHYIHTPANLYPKHYLYTSTRNIGNYLSYAYTYEDESKYKRVSHYVYTFIEQDYLDAK